MNFIQQNKMYFKKQIFISLRFKLKFTIIFKQLSLKIKEREILVFRSHFNQPILMDCNGIFKKVKIVAKIEMKIYDFSFYYPNRRKHFNGMVSGGYFLDIKQKAYIPKFLWKIVNKNGSNLWNKWDKLK